MRRIPPTLSLLATLAALLILCLFSGNVATGQFLGDSTLQSRAAVHIDSLVWGDSENVDFVHACLRRAEFCGHADIEFKGFAFSGASPLSLSKQWSAPNDFLAPPRDSDTGWVYSPDRTRAAYLLRYLGEPDVDLELFDRRDVPKLTQLEMCGTPCRYLGVRWVDDDRLIFVKAGEYVLDRGLRPGISGYYGYVSLYDLSADSVYVYKSEMALRRPSLHVDSVTSVIWDNPDVVGFINGTLDTISIPGFDRMPPGFGFGDSIALSIGKATPDSGDSRYPQPTDGAWVFSPDRSRALKTCCERGQERELWLFNGQGDSRVNLLDSCAIGCKYLATRWLDNDRLIALRLDEDAHINSNTGNRVIDGLVAELLFYDLDRKFVLTHSRYLLLGP
jgi:hypothetical protein